LTQTASLPHPDASGAGESILIENLFFAGLKKRPKEALFQGLAKKGFSVKILYRKAGLRHLKKRQ